MQAVQLSSGDLVADRRASYAEMLSSAGDHAAAADLMRDALALAPKWHAGWYRLGEMSLEAGRLAEAAEAWREALRLDPSDRLGSTLRLGLIGAVEGIDTPPAGFVEALFDQYAPDFDGSLLEKLDYRVPELLAAAIAQTRPGRFAHALDLGCGTGLMGEWLVPMTSVLAGVDISAGMLKRAADRGIYDWLEKADLSKMVFPAGVDLVTAADVFMYVGAMDGVVPRIAEALPAGGIFAFSVEHHHGQDDYILRPSRRYAHSEAYLRRLLADSGLGVRSVDRAAIRMDRGEPIEGLIVVAVKAAQERDSPVSPAIPAGDVPSK